MPLRPINRAIYTDRALALESVKKALRHSNVSEFRADVFVQKLKMCADKDVRESCLSALVKSLKYPVNSAKDVVDEQETRLDVVNESHKKYCSLFNNVVYKDESLKKHKLLIFVAEILNILGYNKAAENMRELGLENYSEPRRLYYAANRNDMFVPRYIYERLNATRAMKELGDEGLWRKHFVGQQSQYTQETLNRIYEKYGTMIYFSEPVMDKALEYIEKELDMWFKVSEGKAIMPKKIDINTYNTSILANKAGGMASEANIYVKSSSIIPNYDHGERYCVVRHEMTHVNDTECDLEQSFIKLLLRRLFSKRENSKINQELENAGIGKLHLKYFYNNYYDSKAVFAEGNMEKYSEGFKKEMVDKYNLPEWILNIKDV